MICERCGKDFEEDYRKYPKGEPRFCSRECANSRAWTDEDKEKKSLSAKNSTRVKKANSISISEERIEKLKKEGEKYRQKIKKELLEAPYEELRFYRLKKRIVIEQNGKCNICGINSWNEKPIVLELEHKDGNHLNNNRDNLEALCPNCHSQTKFWRGRNVKDRKEKITDDELVEAFIEKGNIRQALIKIGLAAKGANYGRLKRALSLRGIEYKGRVQ